MRAPFSWVASQNGDFGVLASPVPSIPDEYTEGKEVTRRFEEVCHLPPQFCSIDLAVNYN